MDPFFTKLYVGPKGITGAELTDEFGSLLANNPQRLNTLSLSRRTATVLVGPPVTIRLTIARFEGSVR